LAELRSHVNGSILSATPESFEVPVKPLHQWSTFHLVLVVAAVVVAIVLVLQLAERLFVSGEPIRAQSTADAPAEIEPLEAEVYIENGDTVVVETEDQQRTRIGFTGDTEDAEAMARCIREEIDRLSTDSSSGERPNRETVVLFGLRIEGRGSDPRVDRAVETCMRKRFGGLPELPVPPDPLLAPGSD
jgi:hypothetical protein